MSKWIRLAAIVLGVEFSAAHDEAMATVILPVKRQRFASELSRSSNVVSEWKAESVESGELNR